MLSSLKGEYGTITELSADVIAIGPGTVESHARFCESMGGCPFPLASDPDAKVARAYGAVDDDGERRRAVYVLDADRVIVHKIPWYQPGNVGQFMEVFQALGLE